MQFNQCGPFPQRNSNYGPFNTFSPPQLPCNPAPEIVGEGEVVSTVNLDGSMQFYFMPVLSYPCGFRSMTTPCINPCGAWLIKSISNPVAASLMNQHGFTSLRCPPMPIPQIQSCFMPDINAKPSYQLKFHNDGCSSTSDLHYFCPSLRTCWWIPPIQPQSPEPPKPQLTCPDVCQESPKVEHPPCECMCVDQQTTKRKQESEKPNSSPSSLCIGTCKKKKKQDIIKTKEKSVRIISSKSSCCSLRSLLNRIKRKTKKRNDNTNRNDSKKCASSCCSHCECSRQATKRKKEEKKPSSCPSNSSGSWSWCKRKKKQDKKDTNNIPPINKNTKEERKPIQSSCTSRFCLDWCKSTKKKQDKGETSKTPTSTKEKTVETGSSYGSSLKSLLDKIKASLSSLYCTPSNCGRKEQTKAKYVKSSKSDENQKKGILAKICAKCKKKKVKTNESTDVKPKNTRSPSSVRILYDSESKGLSRSSERSMSFDPTPSSSRFSLASRHHCGCDKCIRCICNEKALDCECSKYQGIDKQNADVCTCHESNKKQSSIDCKCDNVTEEPKDFCSCKGSQSKKLFCECDKDEPKTQKSPSDCKCPENLKLFSCKCHESKASNENPCLCGCDRDKTQCEERCKNRTCLEKKRSNIKTLKLAQSANGDKKERGHFVCGCDEDGKDETNCDEKCKYKSSLKEVIENKRQTDCRCNNENTKICKCDTDTRKSRHTNQNDFWVLEKVTNKETEKNVTNKETEEKLTNKAAAKKTEPNKCGCAKHSDKKTCDKQCKNRGNLTLRQALPDRPEESFMVIEPTESRFGDSESFLLTSGSSDYCSCRPGRCKYRGTPGDSACSCDSQVE